MIALMLLVFYIPVLVALIYASRSFRRIFIDRKNDALITEKMSDAVIAVGAILTTAVTLLFAFYFPPQKDGELDLMALCIRVAITLMFPFLIGFFLILLSRNWPKKWGGDKGLIIVNRFGIGAFHSIWVLPLSFCALLYMLFGFYYSAQPQM